MGGVVRGIKDKWMCCFLGNLWLECRSLENLFNILLVRYCSRCVYSEI